MEGTWNLYLGGHIIEQRVAFVAPRAGAIFRFKEQPLLKGNSAFTAALAVDILIALKLFLLTLAVFLLRTTAVQLRFAEEDKEEMLSLNELAFGRGEPS